METRKFELTLEPKNEVNGTCVGVEYSGKNVIIDALVSMHALLSYANEQTGISSLTLFGIFEAGFREHYKKEGR